MSIRVLIVDDSVFMRSMLKGALAGAAGVEVLGTAQNGAEALTKIDSLKPDVVTLDVEMPGVDGLEVLEKVMKESPLPIVMVSTKTQVGAEATLKALQLGAIDYVAKPLADKKSTLEGFRANVVRAVLTAANSNKKLLGRKTIAPAPPQAVVRPSSAPPGSVVAIGISAGGPATLHEMMPFIPQNLPPIMITQHMPADFTGPFARRLNEMTKINVKEAEAGDVLVPGMAVIAPGSHHLRLRRNGSTLVVELNDGPKVSGFRPSVDVLFESVASSVGALAVGVVMTGMGCDGAAGIKILKQAGAITLAQDQETSIVYGMPKAAFETGAVDYVVPMQDIPATIARSVSHLAVPA